MPIADAYREDLAYIDDTGSGVVAGEAAGRLIDQLARAECQDGTVVDLGCGSGIGARVD